MAQLTALTRRIALIQGQRDGLNDSLTARPPAIPRGNGVDFHCAIFASDPRDASLVTNLENLASITMQVRAASALGASLFDVTIPADDINTDLTWEEWSEGVASHFVVSLSAEHTGQDLAGKAALPIYIAWQANPIAGDPIFLGSTQTIIFEDGIGSSGDPVVGDPTYLTADEARAEIAALAPSRVVVPDIDLVSGEDGDTVTIFEPTGGAQYVLISALFIPTTVSGELSASAEITLLAGDLIQSTAEALDDATPDVIFPLNLISPRAPITAAHPLTLRKDAVAAGPDAACVGKLSLILSPL